MRRAPIVLLAFLLVGLVTACGGDDEPDPGQGDQASSTPTPTPVPEPGYPLTGEPIEDEAVLDRPVLAVKVDNHPRARPQEGLDRADVVMVEPVEGTTRFIALFHSRDADRVGPVRSGRFVDGDLLSSLEPAFAISGAAEPVLDELGTRDLHLYREGSAGAWTRSGDRRQPHNLFLETAPLFEAASDDGVPPPEQPWPYDDGVTDLDLERGREVTGAELDYPRAESVAWEWDGAQLSRSQDGSPHGLGGGDRVAADNVLVLRVPSTPDPTRPIDPLGSGELVLLRDGREFAGTWEKEADTAHFRWLDEGGQPLRLAPGRTWIELVPDDGAVTVHAAGDADGDADGGGGGGDGGS